VTARPLRFGADRLRVGPRRTELGNHHAAVAQEREKWLDERVGLSGWLGAGFVGMRAT
jgi:hypothetical protein